MRMELQAALASLLAMLPNLELAVDEHQLKWSASHTIRMLPQLPVQWKTA
jgi:cytochrome P450